MSLDVLTLVWDKYPGGGSKLLTMLALADWAGDDGGRIYPSMATLANKIRMSERQAIRIMRALVTDKPAFLEWINPENRGGRNTTNRYRINIETLSKCQSWKLSAVKKNPDTQGVNPDTKGVNPDTQGVNPDIAMSPDPLEPLKPLTGRLTPPRPGDNFGPVPETRAMSLDKYIKHIENMKGVNPTELARAKNELASLDLFPESLNK